MRWLYTVPSYRFIVDVGELLRCLSLHYNYLAFMNIDEFPGVSLALISLLISSES